MTDQAMLNTIITLGGNAQTAFIWWLVVVYIVQPVVIFAGIAGLIWVLRRAVRCIVDSGC